MAVDTTRKSKSLMKEAMDNLQTPPNAVTAQKQLNQLREALQEVQQTSSETPPTAVKTNTVRFEPSQSINEPTNILRALVLYENPALSLLLLLVGTFLLAAVRYMANGPHGMTVLSCKSLFYFKSRNREKQQKS